METIPANDSPGGYFALRRLWLYLRRGAAVRSEDDWREAHFPGYFMFALTFFFFVHRLFGQLELHELIWLPLLVIPVWLTWPLLIHLNAWVAGRLRHLGLTDLPSHRVQSVLFGFVMSLLAVDLVLAPSWMRWFGVVWLAAVALNLGAALVLALWGINGDAE